MENKNMENKTNRHSPSPENTLAQTPSPTYDYHILKGGTENTGWVTTDEKLRMDYLELTANLVETLTQGVEVVNEETGEKERRPYDVVVLLDRSARPISHLLRQTWSRFAKDPNSGEIPPMPDIKFLNMSRKYWVDQLDPNQSGILNIDRINQDDIDSLRSVFLTPGSKQILKNDESQNIQHLPTTLDGKTVLIVDETKYSGETTKIATDFMKRAFKSAHIESTYWMHKRSGNTKTRNPVWDLEIGDADKRGIKGIGKRYADLGAKALSELSPNNYAAYGGREKFVSSPAPDNSAYLELIDEIKALANEKDIPIMPRQRRGERDDDYFDRMLVYTYDIDVSSLSHEEKDALIADTIKRRQAIVAQAEALN